MSSLRVLVVGASIAGPAAAYWLARAGAQVTVIERWPQLRPGGQNIDIRNVGVTVMRKMIGMEDAVKAKIAPLEGFSCVDEKGHAFATMRATGDVNQQSIISDYEIFRGDLSEILYNMTKDDRRIEYVFGEQVSSMRQSGDDEGPITVEFMNGRQSAEFDLVVACDGSTSRTRAIGLNCGVRDYIKPMGAFAAYCTIDQDLLQGSKIGQMFNVVGGRSVGIAPDFKPDVNKAIFMGVFPRNENDATLPFREANKEGQEALRRYVTNHFKGIGWKSDEIIAGAMESKDFYAAEFVQVKVPNMYKGRFAMVGDAAYSPGPVGTGTSLALAGAYVLAGEIGRHKGDLTAGLKAYEERMRPIVDDLQKIPPGVLGMLAPQTAWTLWLRNRLFQLAAWGTRFSGYFGWLTGLWSSALAGDKFGLPDYEGMVKQPKQKA